MVLEELRDLLSKRVFNNFRKGKSMKKIVLILLLLSVAAWSFAAPANVAQRNTVYLDPVSSPSLGAGPVDSPQPDTLRYDDTGTGSYRLTGSPQWPAIRFTALNQFEARSVYLVNTNPNNINDSIDVYAFAALPGNDSVPDLNTLLGQTLRTRVPNGAVWMDMDFITPFTVSPATDFWIVYGDLTAGATTSTTTFWGLLDMTANNFRRSWYYSGSPNPIVGQAALPLFGFDWRCRVGGQYASATYTDLSSIQTFNVSKKFHHVTGSPAQTIQTVVQNTGTAPITSYSITWTAINVATTAVVYTNTMAMGALAVGAVDTVTSNTTFTIPGAGAYNITATVTATGDVVPANNSSHLEQYMYNPNNPYEYYYDDGVFSVNLSFGGLSGVMHRYKPDQYPVVVDSVIIQDGAGTGNLFIYNEAIGGGVGTLLFSAPITLGAGRIAFNAPDPIITSGSVFIGIQNTSGMTIPIDNSVPLAGQNAHMGNQRFVPNAANPPTTWTVDLGADHPIHPLMKLAQAYSVSVTPNRTGNGFIGTTVTYFYTVTNTGINSDSYNLSVSGNSWNTTIWNFGGSSQITNTGNVTGSGGTFQFSVQVFIPLGATMGQTDMFTITATSTTNGTITGSATGVTTADAPLPLPFTENFELATFPPQYWSLVNPDASFTWARNVFNANASAWVNNYNYNSLGALDHLVTPPLNFTGVTQANLNFDVSYRPYSVFDNDSLRIQISYDNGVTWSDVVFYDGGTTLQTRTDGSQNPTMWQTRTASIPATAMGQNDIRLRFTNICYYGDNLYIDNIIVQQVVTGPTFFAAPSPLNFGSAPVGTTISRNLSISNYGTANLVVSSVAFTGNFNGPTTGFTVIPSGTHTFAVDFAPASTGALTGTAVFNHNAAGGSNSVNLNGTGLALVTATGGPDPWGYYYTRNETWGWEDIAGATLFSTGGNQDDDHFQISLPNGFDFKWYGVPVTSLWASSNGWITFSTTAPTATLAGNPTTLGPTAPNAYLGVFNDDLMYGNGTTAWGGMYAETVGNMFVITWHNMDQFDIQLGNYVTFQVQLIAGTNEVFCRYLDSDFGNATYNWGASATLGIEGWNGNSTLTYAINAVNPTAVGTMTTVKYYTSGALAAPSVAASVSGNDLVLNWGSVGTNSTYTIWGRSTNPYLNAGWSPLGSTTSTTYSVTGALPATERYYRITAIEASDSFGANTQIVGEIETVGNDWRVIDVRSIKEQKSKPVIERRIR